MSKEKKLLSNFLHLFSLQGLTFILPLITAPYLFRVLGAEKFGLVSFSLVVMAFLRIVVDYGFQLTATREVAIYRDKSERLNTIFSETMLTKFVLLLFTFLMLTFLIIFIDIFSENWILFYTSFLFVVGHALFPMWFFQGIEEMKYISYLNILSKLLFTIGIFLFIDTPLDYLLYPLFNGLSIVFIGLYALYILLSKYKIKFIWQPINNVYKLLKSGWNIFLGELAPTLYTNFTTFLLGFFVSMESVGYLTLANRFVSATTSILYIARNVTFPYLNKNSKQFPKITFLMISIGILFTLFLFTFSDILVLFLFGEKSTNILELVYILAISPTLYALILSFGSNYLLVRKEDERYKKIVISASLFGMMLSFIFVPYFHIYGAVIIIVLTQTLLALMLFRTYFLDRSVRWL